MYWDLIAATGWTDEYIDNMTLPRVMEIMDAWKMSPPVHWMIAAYLGMNKEKPKSKKKEGPNDWSGLDGLIPITRSKNNG